MSGWQVGDKAVKAKNDCPCCTRDPDLRKPVDSRVYEVVGLSAYSCPQGSGLIIAGVINEHNGQVIGWCRRAWRKVLPDKHEACEEEFVTLLKRSRTPAHA